MEPKTRKEHYLAAIAGEDVTIPEPKTRQEYYLKEIAENGGGGGSFEFVEISYDGETATCNKTFSEIANMTFPIGVLNGQGLSGLVQQPGLHGSVIKGAFIVTRVGELNTNHCVSVTFHEDGSITAFAQELAYN